MKKIKATFLGQNGSCGFKTGFSYVLILTYVKGENIRIVTESSNFSESNEEKVCEYSNILTFFDNWNHILIIS